MAQNLQRCHSRGVRCWAFVCGCGGAVMPYAIIKTSDGGFVNMVVSDDSDLAIDLGWNGICVADEPHPDFPIIDETTATRVLQ